MRANRPIRLIRKPKAEANTELFGGATVTRPQPSEREIKTAVSRWVRDHRQRSEEFRRTFATLWQGAEFQYPPVKS